jgi:hypothetical protein
MLLLLADGVCGQGPFSATVINLAARLCDEARDGLPKTTGRERGKKAALERKFCGTLASDLRICHCRLLRSPSERCADVHTWHEEDRTNRLMRTYGHITCDLSSGNFPRMAG